MTQIRRTRGDIRIIPLTTGRFLEQDLYSQQVFQCWDKLERLVQKRFLDANTAQEASLYLLEKLEEDDWRRIRAYNGKAKFSTFLHCLAGNLLEDFSRKKFGRFRPPQWLVKQGVLWTKVFKLLCLERITPPEVIGSLSSRAANPEPHSGIAEIIAVILAEIPDCGKVRWEATASEPEELENRAAQSPALHNISPEQYLALSEQVQLAKGIGQLLTTGTVAPTSGDIASLIKEFDGAFSLKDEERLLLKMIYQDQLSASQAGKLLGWGVNKTHGKLRRLLARLEKTLRKLGLEETLRNWLQKDRQIDL